MNGKSMAAALLESTPCQMNTHSSTQLSAYMKQWTWLSYWSARELGLPIPTSIGWVYDELCAILQFSTVFFLRTHTHTHTLQTDDFNKAFLNTMGVQPLLECLYSQVLIEISLLAYPLIWQSIQDYPLCTVYMSNVGIIQAYWHTLGIGLMNQTIISTLCMHYMEKYGGWPNVVPTITFNLEAPTA